MGYDRDAFLYDLQLWEIQLIIRGYRHRARTAWETMRWQTWAILCALGAKGYDEPKALLPFPWEQEPADIPDDEEINKMRKHLQELNSGMGG